MNEQTNLHLVSISAQDEIICPKSFLSFLLFIGRGANNSHMVIEGLSEFHGNVAEAS